MSYRYSTFETLLRKLYRKWRPVPGSPWTAGAVRDICEIHLVPPDALIEFFRGCLRQLRELRGEEIGNYLEFGVFNGSSIGSMQLACDSLGLSQVRLFGFDSFQGLPEESATEDDGVWKKGFYSCSFEQMSSCLQRRGIDPDKITWVKGWYSEILTPETAQRLALESPGIVFIDCDTYSSSSAVLEFVAPFLTKPCVLCFDDWKLNDLDLKNMGEYRAFNEFIDRYPSLMVREIRSYNRKSKTFLVIPRKV